MDANPAAVRLAGRDFTGQRMREIDPDYEEYWYDTYGQVALSGEPIRAEHYAASHGRWFDFHLSRVGSSESRRVASVFQDITERKKSEEALRKSEERLRNVLNGMEEAFGLMDRDLRIITQNKAALAMDGRPLEELRGRKHSEVYPNADPEVIALYDRALAEGKAVSLDHRYGWDEDRASWLEMRAFPVPEGLAVFWRDISERKQAEEQLRQGEERYRKLFESMDQAYAVVEVLKDDDGKWCDFRFVEVNPAFTHHTNMPPPVGKTATELLGTPNPRWTQLYGQALDTGAALRVEESEPVLGLTFDLNLFTLDRAKNRVAVLFTNITERKKAEEALLEGERQRSAMLDVLPLGLGLMNKDGEVVLSNPEWSRFIPTNRIPSRDPERGWRWRSWDKDGQLIEPADFPNARALRGESVVPPMEFLYKADDGTEIWTSVAAVPLHDARGEVTGAVSVIQNIDAAKRASETLEESERHAQMLLAELQHRVRNILAMIRSIVRRSAADDAPAEDYIKHLEGRISALARTQVLLTRAPDAGVDLVSIIREELAAQSADNDRLSIGGEPVELSPKAAEVLALAIHELATNSVKYGALSQPSGTLCVTWKVDDRAGEAWLRYRWVEKGVGVVDAIPRRKGFGTELITERVPYELKGSGTFEIKPGGLESCIEFPLRKGGSVLQTSGGGS